MPPKHASPSDGGALYKAGNPISIPQLNLCRFFIFHLCFGNIGIGWYNLCLLNLWLRFFQFLRNWLGDLPLNRNHQIQKNSPSNSDHGLAQSARGADKGNLVEVWAQVDGCMGFIEDGHVMQKLHAHREWVERKLVGNEWWRRGFRPELLFWFPLGELKSGAGGHAAKIACLWEGWKRSW